jgi:azurin
MNSKLILTFAILLVLSSGCTKKSEEGDVAGIAAANKTEAGAMETTINLGSVGETMAYDKTDLTVPAGKDITLNFKNNSTTLQHNWVLTQPGKDNDIGLAGIKAGMKKGFITDDPALAPSILAHTKLVEPGSADSITFKAPPAGDYPFICTNAGHHTVMKGVLHSK